MSTRNAGNQSKTGGVLVMAAIVVLAFSVLSIGLFRLYSSNMLETVYTAQSKQAFWVAEAGLLDAIQRLRYDFGFHSSAVGGSATFSVSNNVGTASYDVTVSDMLSGDPMINLYQFEIKSVGWVGGFNRQIRQYVDTMPGIIAAITSPKNINIAQNTLVDGPIAVLDGGTLTLNDKIPPGQNQSGDYDLIILDDGSSISRRSGASEGEHYDIVDLPAPEMPVMPDFSSYLTAAQAQGITSPTNINLGTIDLGGITNYYNVLAGITIEKITGEGTIVNTGSITLTPKSTVGDVDVAEGVSILSFQTVTVGQKNDFAGDALIYSAGTVYFGDHSIALAKSVILADGKDLSNNGITMGGHSQFQGIVFADDGDIDVEQGSNGAETRIEGTMISGGSVTVGQNSEVIFNRDMFNDDLFDLGEFFDDQVVVTKRIWEELSPL